MYEVSYLSYSLLEVVIKYDILDKFIIAITLMDKTFVTHRTIAVIEIKKNEEHSKQTYL